VVDHNDYKILYVNPAYEEVFGRSLKTVYERPTSWIDAVAPEDRDRIKAALENQQRTGMFDENFRIIRPNHSVRWIHDRVFPIRDVHGEIFRVVGIAEDITEQMQALQSTAADEERRRLARQLHDSVTQSLYSLTLMTNGWAAMSENGKLENPAESFRQLENLGVQALGEMRLLIHQLRPPTLEEMGLAGALQERLDAVERRLGLEAQLFIEGDLERLPRQVEEELFHITQEALNNTLRHAEASNILVRLVVENGSARLTIEDDGRGFNLTHANGGLGLTSMRERAESVSGQFQLTSGNGNGTLVDVVINLIQD
jgi:PAS domain S-box-containing protein